MNGKFHFPIRLQFTFYNYTIPIAVLNVFYAVTFLYSDSTQ